MENIKKKQHNKSKKYPDLIFFREVRKRSIDVVEISGPGNKKHTKTTFSKENKYPDVSEKELD